MATTTERTGSFPFMNIAQDFGLPYGTVLRCAEERETGRVCMTTDDSFLVFVDSFYPEFERRIDAALALLTPIC